MRWTPTVRRTSAPEADGQVVWSWLPDAGVKFRGSESFSGMTVANKPGHRGEHEAAVKTIARGMSGDSGVTCTLVCVFLLPFAHETVGASGARHSLRPHFGEGGNLRANLGRNAPRECESVSSRHCEERKRRSNPAFFAKGSWIASLRSQ